MAKNSLRKNFLYQMSYQLLVIVLPLVTSPYVSRILGPTKIGVFSYTYTIATYFALFSALGIQNYGNRSIAAVRDDQRRLNKTFSSIFTLMFITSVIVTIVYIAFLQVFKSQYRPYLWIQVIYILATFFDVNWFFFGIEQFKITVTRNSIVKLATVVAIFVFVRNGNDLWKYCLIMALGTLVSQSVVWIFLPRYVRFVRFSFSELTVHIKPLLVLFIPVLAISLYQYMDKIMLGTLSSQDQVGYFENAQKGINIPISIITAFGTVMLPKISNLVAKQSQRLIRRYLALSVEAVMCIAVALSFGMASVARQFSVIFWGNQFASSGLILTILAISIPFIAFANILRTQFLIPSHRDSSYTSSVVCGAITNVFLNLLLIPRLGAVGAAIGTVAAEAVVCVVQTMVVVKELPIKKYLQSFLIYFFFGVVMFTEIYLIRTHLQLGIVWNFFLEVIVGALTYSTLCVVYLLINKNSQLSNLLYLTLRSKRTKGGSYK